MFCCLKMKNKMERPPRFDPSAWVKSTAEPRCGGALRNPCGEEAGGGLNVRESAREKLVTKDGSLCVVGARDLESDGNTPTCRTRMLGSQGISSFSLPCAFR